jgi:ribosomal protein L29
MMAWTDPAAMSVSEIEAALDEIERRLLELRGHVQAWELEAKKFRLQAEQRYREGKEADG